MQKSFLYIICIALLCYACKKETGVAGPAGPAGSNGLNGSALDTGTLYGNLAAYDEFSWPLSDSSGVKVSLQQGATILSATSDRSGNYFFHGLPSGTYNLTYEKASFGTMKVFGISHSPGSDQNTRVPEVYVLQNPVKTAIDSISLTTYYSSIVVTIYMDTSSLTYSQYQYNFALLIGSDPHPSLQNTALSPLSEYIFADGHGAYTFGFNKSGLGGNNQPNGPYYISVGTFNRYIRGTANLYSLFDPGFSSYYVDPANGKYVFPNLKLAPNKVVVQ